MNVMQYQHYQTQEPRVANIPGTLVIGMPNRRNELVVTEGVISVSKQKRLAQYARHRLEESGFGPLLDHCEVSMYEIDDNGVTVRFMTKQGGYLEVCGIQTTKGWPQLDFEIDVGVE
jgi:hypothetical protein